MFMPSQSVLIAPNQCKLHHLNSSHPLSIAALIVLLCCAMIFTGQWTTSVSGQAIPAAPTSPYQQQDPSDPDGLCNEFHKECHCGSIAQPQGTALYTRIVYPNSSTVIEEYDEDVPYGYKYLRVFYRCADEENVLVGNNMRECSSGNWIGQVPRCAFNMRNETKLKQMKITDYKYNSNASIPFNATHQLSNVSAPAEKPLSVVTLYYDQDLKQSPTGAFEIPLKSQPEECLRWSLFPKQVWSLTLNKPTRIHYVRIKLYGDHIEDLHQNDDIKFDMVLKNITYFELPMDSKSHNHNQKTGHVKLPIELKCKETTPKASQYVDSYQQKYSANYLVLDFLCEIENIQKSIFEYFFSYDYEVDQLYANIIEVRFTMVERSTGETTTGKPNSIQSDELEFKQKISVTSLCELKLYTFHNDCGIPDIPVSAIVQRDFNFLDESERKTYKYICNDKNQELKGNSFVECGNYGRWKNDFPQCIRILPCRPLSNILTNNQEYMLDVKYESTTFTKSGNQVVPNGKYARFSCIKRNQTNNKYDNASSNRSLSTSTSVHNNMTTPPANVKAHVMIQGTTQVICRNGKWIGLESANSNCISLPRAMNVDIKKLNNATSDDPAVQLVSLPVRLIRILFALFIILCLIIISLLVYMFIFRQQMNRANSLKSNYIGMNHFDLNSNLIPTILYNGTVHSPSNHDNGIIYSTENNIYERVSLEHFEDSHLYQTIKINNHNDNYSDISTIGYDRTGQHEERENSIYGMEDFDVSTADLDSLSTNQLTIDKNYNQLDRSSSMFMKSNSIYEM